MEMDDLFEKHQDDEADDMENGGTGEIDGEWEEDDDLPCHQNSQPEHQAPQSTYGFGSNGHHDQNQGIAAGHRQGHGNVGNNLNQSKPPKGNSQSGKRPISMASKRNSGIRAYHIMFYPRLLRLLITSILSSSAFFSSVLSSSSFLTDILFSIQSFCTLLYFILSLPFLRISYFQFPSLHYFPTLSLLVFCAHTTRTPLTSRNPIPLPQPNSYFTPTSLLLILILLLLPALMNTNEDDERDGLDIQSLSVVEAEFFFNKTDEGKSAADIAATKRTINLDAFHIIKVIGKGNDTFFCLLCVIAVCSGASYHP